MNSRWHRFNLMVSRVRNHLHDPANEPLWQGQIGYLDTRVTEMESAADALGAFGDKQSASIKGTTEQQNAAETALEDGAHALGHLLYLYYRQQGNLAKAGEWKLTRSDWRALTESALLNKAKALRTEASALTTGTPPAGAAFGINTTNVTAYSQLVDAYDQQIGAPTDARSDRKSMTSQLRGRYAELREMLTDIDGMMETLRPKSDAHNLFVEGYVAARRIGGYSANGGDEEPSTPPAPPTP